jgi:hypothetical protein
MRGGLLLEPNKRASSFTCHYPSTRRLLTSPQSSTSTASTTHSNPLTITSSSHCTITSALRRGETSTIHETGDLCGIQKTLSSRAPVKGGGTRQPNVLCPLLRTFLRDVCDASSLQESPEPGEWSRHNSCEYGAVPEEGENENCRGRHFTKYLDNFARTFAVECTELCAVK